MAFTRVVGPGIHTQSNINSHNIKSTGIITATKFDGPFDSLTVSGNLSIGGTLTYEDVTNVDSVGVITARSGIQGIGICLLYTSPSPRDMRRSRMPSSA